MLPKTHVSFGFLFAGALYLIFPQIGLIGAGIIWLSSFLIDVDHYIWYVIEEKNLSIKKAYHWHRLRKETMRKLPRKEKLKHKNEILFLHGFEPIAVLFALSYLWQPFLYILIGFAFHLSLDIIEEIKTKHRIDKIFLIHDVIKYHKLDQLGL